MQDQNNKVVARAIFKKKIIINPSLAKFLNSIRLKGGQRGSIGVSFWPLQQ